MLEKELNVIYNQYILHSVYRWSKVMLHCTFPTEKERGNSVGTRTKPYSMPIVQSRNERKFNKQSGGNTRFGDTELKKESNINDIQCTDEMTKTSGIIQTYL